MGCEQSRDNGMLGDFDKMDAINNPDDSQIQGDEKPQKKIQFGVSGDEQFLGLKTDATGPEDTSVRLLDEKELESKLKTFLE